MKNQDLSKVTIIYYHEQSLELLHMVCFFPKQKNGRLVIPESFKKEKSILAVCEGEIEIMNKIGDRILSIDAVA